MRQTVQKFVAATPSAAAELLTEGMMRRREWVAQSTEQMFTLVLERVEAGREHVQWLASRLARSHPRRQMNQHRQQLDDWQRALARSRPICERKARQPRQKTRCRRRLKRSPGVSGRSRPAESRRVAFLQVSMRQTPCRTSPG